MPQAVFETQIDADLMNKAQGIFSAAGMTPADAFRRLLLLTVQEHAVPLDLFVPNEDTLRAIQDAREGKLEGPGSIADLFAQLDADD